MNALRFSQKTVCWSLMILFHLETEVILTGTMPQRNDCSEALEIMRGLHVQRRMASSKEIIIRVR